MTTPDTPTTAAEWLTDAYKNHQQWAERLHALHDRLIQLNTETAAVLREISAAERNEQSSREFVQETFDNWRESLAGGAGRVAARAEHQPR